MITQVSTAPAPAPLAARPDGRRDAESLVRAFAAGAAASADDEPAVCQYGRILSVMLWHDVDQTDFSLLVDDVAKLAMLTAGVPLDGLVGDVEETDAERGEWMFYYETQVNWRVGTILDSAGYAR